MNRKNLLLCWVLGALGTVLLAGCHHNTKRVADTADTTDYATVAVPPFCADSAYAFVSRQVAFGPRTPGSRAQQQCATWIVRQLHQWCDTVVVQDFPATLWDGTRVCGKNIVASLEGNSHTPDDRRILLAAHWDSRLWADQDPDLSNRRKPIDGANDGASGVGVLMELARAMAQQRPSTAVDIIFFDVEDQGTPSWADNPDDETWCLGSQYWSRNPHMPLYHATYGILLDMVGTRQPRYTKEEISRTYAPGLLDKVWHIASALGYKDIFADRYTPAILDDHYFVNTLAGIPMIDIVQNSEGTSFFPHWHTLSDNMEQVDKNSLHICCRTLLTAIYADYPNQ